MRDTALTSTAEHMEATRTVPAQFSRVELVALTVAPENLHRLEVWRIDREEVAPGKFRLYPRLIDYADTEWEWREVARTRGPGRYRVTTQHDGQVVARFIYNPKKRRQHA